MSAENKDSNWFTYDEPTIKKEKAREFDRVFADLYKELNIKPILEENGKSN